MGLFNLIAEAFQPVLDLIGLRKSPADHHMNIQGHARKWAGLVSGHIGDRFQRFHTRRQSAFPPGQMPAQPLRAGRKRSFRRRRP